MCDFFNCNIENIKKIIRFVCFYICYCFCLEKYGNFCFICKDFFFKRIIDLSDIFNSGLLEIKDNLLVINEINE